MNIVEKIQKRTAQVYLELRQKNLVKLQDIKILEDDEAYNTRLKICYVCEQFIKDKNKCNICGCNMKLKAKIHLFNCPLEKW